MYNEIYYCCCCCCIPIFFSEHVHPQHDFFHNAHAPGPNTNTTNAPTETRIAFNPKPAVFIANTIMINVRIAHILASFSSPDKSSKPAIISPITAIQNQVVTERKVNHISCPAHQIIATASAGAQNFIAPNAIIATHTRIRIAPIILLFVVQEFICRDIKNKTLIYTQ